MILATAFKRREHIAFFFFCIFYAQLCWPTIVFAQAGVTNFSASKVFVAHESAIYPWQLGQKYLYRTEKDNGIKSDKPIKTNLSQISFIPPKDSLQGSRRRKAKPDGPGPGQPEMQSFQSVNSNNLVDLFTGDFSYNIPLLDVGGYPINIQYQSGITMDQEASWVGLGWNINPGTIMRNMRGIPDDFDGEDTITKTMNIKPDKTLGFTVGPDWEIIGREKITKISTGNDTQHIPALSAGASFGIFHNTYKGWGTEIGINTSMNAGMGAAGALTAGLSVTNNSQDGLDINRSIGISLSKLEKLDIGNISIGSNYNSRTGIQNLQMTAEMGVDHIQLNNTMKDASVGMSIPLAMLSFSKPSFTPTISMPYTSGQFTFNLKVGKEKNFRFKDAYIKAYSSVEYIAASDTVQKRPAYGYLYYQKANNNGGGLLDFNRDKDVPYRENTPNIAVPSYTYDIYSISGEGTGGMFRPYRGDIGFVHDHNISTKSNSNRFSFELGFYSQLHLGVDFTGSYSSTKNRIWTDNNILNSSIAFDSSYADHEAVYFKNPGEKTSVNQQFYNAVGGTDLIKANLVSFNNAAPASTTLSNTLSRYENAKITGTTVFNKPVIRQTRDRRTEVISYFTADEASEIGLDTLIKSYLINVFPYSSCNQKLFDTVKRVDDLRKGHHLSELTVLNPDGRRYIYGIPAYNTLQKDVMFSTDPGDNTTGLVNYHPSSANPENSVFNTKGIDGYYNAEKMPGYAHSFLLTGILSPDYVDIKGDGITDDDKGDAVKFNYSRIYDNVTPYRWRAPYQDSSASYNDGLKTDSRDEKGSYSYGTKEIWYLNSVESKTMMAVFKLETDSLRKDALGTKDENGGRDNNQRLYRLKEIDLYSKADILKNSLAGAKPIKTVHFDYDYSLCKATPSSEDVNTGKLTLRRIWFSYNKNEKGRLNPYVFNYSGNNPNYHSNYYDRWGNYKDPANNPGQLTNTDYPYSLQGTTAQDSINAAASAANWTLTDISLPSGGRMKVTYESDDYAYVQNKRAMQFFQFAGFGSDSTSSPSQHLYTQVGIGINLSDYQQNDYIFIKIPDALTSANYKNEILQKYLDGVTKLYLKIFVQMPDDTWGSGSEFVPCWADIDSYGIKGSPSNKTIWIKLKRIDGKNPLLLAATQFLRLNLPSKAYPDSEPGDDLSIGQVLGTLKTVADNISEKSKGFFLYALGNNWCNSIDDNKSLVRLDNPNYKKYGGGLRVKRIEIFDNWNTMTSDSMKESEYGQEFDYSTTQEINGVETRISSGVAAYEPVIGRDENPFVVAADYYKEQVGALAPTNYFFTEDPLTESYFPSPMIGYSKVSVQSINNDKKSATGKEETEFYTTYDFPTKTETTPLADGKVEYNPTVTFFNFDVRHYVTLSQGFKVELNDMNGKIKRQASYAQNDLQNPINYTINYYKLDNDTLQANLSNTVPVIDSANGVINNTGQIGNDVEMLVDLREQKTTMLSPGVGANVDIKQFVPPILAPSVWPKFAMQTDRYRSVAIVKIVNRYGILDSVIHVENGSKVSTKNMIYDGETGDVLLSRTNNEFDDPIYNFNYPAHWEYSGMSGAYKNIGVLLSGQEISGGKFIDSTNEKFFESGDEILLTGRVLPPTLFPGYHCNSTIPDNDYQNTTMKIWAISASKGMEGDRGLYFIDSKGNPISARDAVMKIIRSGKRNMLDVPIGTITSLISPVKYINGQWRISIDSTTQVVAASAARFKDLWEVDSTLYPFDSCYLSVKIDSFTESPLRSLLVKQIYTYGHTYVLPSKYNYPFFSAAASQKQYKSSRSNILTTRSVLGFDFSQLPDLAIILNAQLSLDAMPLRDTSYGVESGKTWLYDFPNAHIITNNSRSGYTNQVSIYRVKNAWDRNSTFNNVYYGLIKATSSGTANNSCDDVLRLDCTPLLQEISLFKNSSYGLLMRLDQEDKGTSHTNDAIRSYYSGLPPGRLVDGENCDPGFSDGSYPLPGHEAILHHEPVLKVKYEYFRDTCIQLCRPNIDTGSINPYVWGILGNWRADRAYTYYNKRKESDPTVPTDIRKNGQIKSFVPYWNFTDSILTSNNDTTRWVWNSQSNLFNRRGFEIENNDPLLRYNSGQYGYNQSLPVAIAQNSKNRNMCFDGFEDYNYQNTCSELCPPPRFINFSGSGTFDSVYRHTGKYSLKISGSSEDTANIKITSLAQDTAFSGLSFKIDSTYIVDTLVQGTGNGLFGYYNVCGQKTIKVDTTVNNNKFPNAYCGKFSYEQVQWTGRIQPRYSGYYTFLADYNGRIQLSVTDANGIKNSTPSSTYYNIVNTTAPKALLTRILLYAGKTYDLNVVFTPNITNGRIALYWQSNGYPHSQPLEIIPKAQLYHPVLQGLSLVYPSVVSTITPTAYWCVNVNPPKPKNITLPLFSPLQGTKMVVGAWVKEDQPCISGSYSNNSINISFSGSSTTYSLRPSGNIIEGWQRIEEVITIPAGATNMKIELKALSGTAVYFDDIRMHPFNSNIKSYVYDPISLRLMAELDENNYASFYEYDDDGTLIRVKKETEKGIKLVQETRSALLKDNN